MSSVCWCGDEDCPVRYVCRNDRACLTVRPTWSDLRKLRAELAALKATHAAELRAVAERQREATTQECVKALANHVGGLLRESVRIAGRATSLVTGWVPNGEPMHRDGYRDSRDRECSACVLTEEK